MKKQGYYIRTMAGITGKPSKPLQPVKVAVRLGLPVDDNRIRERHHAIPLGDGRYVYDFGPARNVRYWDNEKKEYRHRAARSGDYFIRFVDNSWKLMTENNYRRYLYLLKKTNE